MESTKQILGQRRQIKTGMLIMVVGLLVSSAKAIASPTVADSVAFVTADYHWHSLGRGAEAGVAQFELFGRPATISIVKYPMRRWRTRMVHAPRELSSTADSLAMREHAMIAINGSYFNMREFTPVTFFSTKHQIVGRQDKSTVERSTGIVACKGRNVYVLAYDSTEVEFISKRYDYALQSGPLLLLNGEPQPFDNISFNTVNHPRSLIGITSKGECIMVVVDGRLKGNAEGATMEELLHIAKWLGMHSAVNLDGGGSSTLWTAADGTLNYPCDNKRYDKQGLRRIPNIIIVK